MYYTNEGENKKMSLPTIYQQFIHLSRYARWLDTENRRETWEETVKRYFVCSYGGCASWTLLEFLQNNGVAYHIHSNRPPELLTLPVSRKLIHRLLNYGMREHFSNRKKHRIIDTSNCYVIYLYVKPSNFHPSTCENK